MRRSRLAFAFSTLTFLVTSSAQAQRPGAGHSTTRATTIELNLIVGENKTIATTDVSSYSVGTPGVVDVKVPPSMDVFVFVGLHAGSTSVLMLKNNGTEVTYNVGRRPRSSKSSSSCSRGTPASASARSGRASSSKAASPPRLMRTA